MLFSSLTMPGMSVMKSDLWDGYPAARERVFDMIDGGKITNLAILTGDIHSSWALDVPRNPWTGYDPKTASGSRGVEIVAPAISSPPMFPSASQRDLATALRPLARHLKFLEGESRGYVLLDITPDTLTAEWYLVPTVTERTDREARAARFVLRTGIVPADSRVGQSPALTAYDTPTRHRPDALRTHAITAAMRRRPCGCPTTEAGSRWRRQQRPLRLSREGRWQPPLHAG